MLTLVKETVLCPRCNGDGAVFTHIPNETESTYGWAGYVPCPHCGGCGHIRCGGPKLGIATAVCSGGAVP
jgi:DnaJ-class molecular chaperone